ncbi:hypothetical protein NHQ30_000580 [Ciborinia camelliae]|nr:hypothetical protein NHQ30_000580 [Ciborinia camelliae]
MAKLDNISAGLKWGQIYEYLESNGMMVSGGRASLVGIGGLVVGGGNSPFAPKKGFVVDAVTNFELVAGNGSIINVNATSNSDLFADDPKANFFDIWNTEHPRGNLICCTVEAPGVYSDGFAIPDLIFSTMRITNVSSLINELVSGIGGRLWRGECWENENSEQKV